MYNLQRSGERIFVALERISRFPAEVIKLSSNIINIVLRLNSTKDCKQNSYRVSLKAFKSCAMKSQASEVQIKGTIFRTALRTHAYLLITTSCDHSFEFNSKFIIWIGEIVF